MKFSIPNSKILIGAISAILAVVLFSGTAFADMQRREDVAMYMQGNGALFGLGGAQIFVYSAGTTSLVPIYSDQGITPKSNPFYADSAGGYYYYAVNGTYDEKFVKTGYTPTTRHDVTLAKSSGTAFLASSGKYATLNALVSAVAVSTNIGIIDAPLSAASGTLTISVPLDLSRGNIVTCGSGTLVFTVLPILTSKQTFNCSPGQVLGLPVAIPDQWQQNSVPGTTDMSTAITAASLAASGHISLMPKAIYGIGSTLALSSPNITIDGNDATLKLISGIADTKLFYQLGNSSITMTHLIIDGNDAAVTPSANAVLVQFGYSTTVAMDHCTIQNALVAGLIHSYGNTVSITNSVFQNCGSSALQVANISKSVIISGNYVYNTYSDGIVYNVNTAASTQRVLIANNVVDTVHYLAGGYLENGLGITVNANDTSTMNDVVVSNNIVTNADSMAYSLTLYRASGESGRMSVTGNVATNSGNGMSTTTGIGIELSGKNITCTGNMIKNSDAVGISGWNLENATISGNTIDRSVNQTGSNQMDGIRLCVISGTDYNRKVSIEGNTVTSSDTSTSGATDGIGVYGICPNGINTGATNSVISIANNQIQGNFAYGILVTQQGDIENIVGNNVNLTGATAAGGAALAFAGTRVNVSNNILTPKYGYQTVSLQNIAGSDNISLMNNTIYYPYYLASGISFNLPISGTTPNVMMMGNTMIAGSGWGAAAIAGRANCYTLTESNNSWNYDTAAPTVGTFKKGNRVINSAPAQGLPKSWVCTSAGTPGTWVADGQEGPLGSIASAPTFTLQTAVTGTYIYLSTGITDTTNWKQISN
jgi:hypothetical protein